MRSIWTKKKSGAEIADIFRGTILSIRKNPAHPVSAGKKCGSGNYVCGLWEPYEIQLTERREAIKEKLQRIAESLNDVVLILKDDE